ncbi:MAG: hypothetical protein HQ513_15680 [Rhodospirillales bacterium]|nr:hypothetical protein [Rhodospirillales bacterium]
MNEFLGIDPSIPVFHLVPFIVFGPIFLFVLYHIGLKDLFNPSPEMREQIRLRKEAEAREVADHKQKMSVSGLKLNGSKRTPLQLLGQALSFAVLALIIATFSSAPAYVAHAPEKALLMLSFTHAGKHQQECHKRSREELAKLAANMRAPMKCSRERWPVIVELALDDKEIYQGVASPAGVRKDGHSSFYQKFSIPAGTHKITVGVWDSRSAPGEGGHDFVLDSRVDLVAQEILVIGFDNAGGRITLE